MVSDFDAEIGKRVKAIMDMREISQRALAEQVGISHVYLGNLVRGARRWQSERLKDVCDALGVPVHLVEDLSVPLERIDVIAQIVESLRDLPEDRLSTVASMLEALVPPTSS